MSMIVQSVNCKIFDGVACLLARGVSSWLPNGPCRPSLEAFWAIGGGLGSVGREIIFSTHTDGEEPPSRIRQAQRAALSLPALK